MRKAATRQKLRALMSALARAAPHQQHGRVYLVGGGTAVWMGWRPSTVDIDLYGAPEGLFHDIQKIKQRLNINVEFARPEDFVPPLAGSDDRHVFIETIGRVSFFHHDPYAQAFSKIVRGFERDLRDAEQFVSSGMVDANRLRALVQAIPSATYAKYPALSQDGVLAAVGGFVGQLER